MLVPAGLIKIPQKITEVQVTSFMVINDYFCQKESLVLESRVFSLLLHVIKARRP